MKTIALIPAAGMGRRMDAGVNKQYLQLADRPILAHTLALFDTHPRIDRIVVISPAEEIAYCRREVVERFGFRRVHAVTAGGAQRQDSVRKGLAACGGLPEDIVLVHDGVRPFFPAERLDALIDTAAAVGACVVGMPVKDTIKSVESGRIAGTPDRDRLWLAQTPQAFRFALLERAHKEAEASGFSGTDDASLVEALGEPVAMIEGDYRNIKITTPEDLTLARAILAERTA